MITILYESQWKISYVLLPRIVLIIVLIIIVLQILLIVPALVLVGRVASWLAARVNSSWLAARVAGPCIVLAGGIVVDDVTRIQVVRPDVTWWPDVVLEVTWADLVLREELGGGPVCRCDVVAEAGAWDLQRNKYEPFLYFFISIRSMMHEPLKSNGVGGSRP